METQKKAYAYAITAVLIWSTVASAFKISLRYISFIQLLFYASLTSLLVLLLILIFQKKMKLLKGFSKKDYLNSAFLGFLNPFLYYIVLFRAYSLLKAQEAQALNYIWGVVLAILSIPLLKQKIGIKNISGICVSFVGAFIISTEGRFSFHFSNLEGITLALGSAFIWAIFWIFNVRDKRDEVAKLFLNFLFGIIFITIFMFSISEKISDEIEGIAGAIYVGIFEMGITFVIWIKALKLSKTSAQVGNLIYLSPFISLFIIHFLVGEKILLSTPIGLIFIISGIIIQYR